VIGIERASILHAGDPSCTVQSPDTTPGLIRSGFTFGLSVMTVPEKFRGRCLRLLSLYFIRRIHWERCPVLVVPGVPRDEAGGVVSL